ncbi:MAG TPA: hypothetical protein VFT46_09645 [Holophagaceae bacterium]|nr:hypothetical protein [Holophagaceae bacterium]
MRLKRSLRLLSWSLGGAVLLLGLFHLEENARGRRAWEAWKAQRVAQGDRYDWSKLAPPPVPDAENFAKEPLVEAAVTGKAPLLGGFSWPDKAPAFADWRLGQTQDVGAWAAAFGTPDLASALKPLDGRLDELTAATERPACRMPFRYHYPEISRDPIPGLLGFRAAARVLSLRAVARLRSGDAAGALEDCLAGLRLVRQFQAEPSMLSSLLAQALSGIAMQGVWEGLSTHAWSEPQLARLQAELGKLDLLAAYRRALESERVFAAQAGEAELRASGWQQAKDRSLTPDAAGDLDLDRFRALGTWLLVPSGWHGLTLREMDRHYVEGYLPAVDPGAHRIHLDLLRRTAAQDTPSLVNPYGGIAARMLVPQGLRTALHQNALDEARTVCALERHRLAHGAYPATLEALVPAFLDRVPTDVVDGTALRYRLEGPGTFRLYALGPDGQDGGGQPAKAPDGRLDPERGDWAWPEAPSAK